MQFNIPALLVFALAADALQYGQQQPVYTQTTVTKKTIPVRNVQVTGDLRVQPSLRQRVSRRATVVGSDVKQHVQKHPIAYTFGATGALAFGMGVLSANIVKDFFRKLSATLRLYTPQFLIDFWGALKSMYSRIEDNAKWVANKLGYQRAKAFIKKLGDRLNKFWNSFFKNTKHATSAAKNAVGAQVNAVKATAADLASTAAGAVADVTGSASAKLNAKKVDAKDEEIRMREAAADETAILKDNLTAGVEEVKETARDGAATVAKETGEAMENVGDRIAEQGAEAKRAGEDMEKK